MMAETETGVTAGGEPDATGYRWARAAGGEVPAGAPAAGHGWRWRDTDDGGEEREPLWLVRSLPGPDGAVRLGWVARGESARTGSEFHPQPVDEYEVLLDAGEWAPAEFVDDESGGKLDFVAAGGVACGRLADGSPLYATLRDREGEGYAPGENGPTAEADFFRSVLVAASRAATPAEPAPAPVSQDPPTAPVAVVSALDLRGEIAEISNTGDAALDLGGWTLHDEGARKRLVFARGTVVAPGGSLRVRSGPGAASAGPGELEWTTTKVWNDKGDTAYLKDPSGELVSSRKG